MDEISEIDVIESDVKDVEQKCEKVNCSAIYVNFMMQLWHRLNCHMFCSLCALKRKLKYKNYIFEWNLIFKVMPRVRRVEADTEIILCNNLLASLARKLNSRARASTGRTSRDHCAPLSPSGISRGTGEPCTVHVLSHCG